MNKMCYNFILRITKLINVVLITIPFLLCWFNFYARRTASPFYFKGNWVVVALFFVLYIIFGRVYEAFFVSMNRISEMIYSQMLAATMSDCIMYVVIFLLMKHIPNPLPLIFAFLLQIIFSICWCYIAHKTYYKLVKPQNTIIVYDVRQGLDSLIQEYDLNNKFNVVQSIHISECLNNLKLLNEGEVCFLSGIRSHDRNVIIKYCVENNIVAYVIPRIGDVLMSGAKIRHMLHLPVLQVGRCNPSPEYLLIKRTFDIIMSLFALIITSPIMLVSAIAIKVTDKGEIFLSRRDLQRMVKCLI